MNYNFNDKSLEKLAYRYNCVDPLTVRRCEERMHHGESVQKIINELEFMGDRHAARFLGEEVLGDYSGYSSVGRVMGGRVRK